MSDVFWLNNPTILFNNQNRFPKRPATYFRMVQPINFHSRVPDKNVYLYSFSFNPEYYQPTGCCNFTKLDAKLQFDDASNKFNPNNYFNYWLNFDGNPLTRLDHTKNTTILLNGNPINQRLKGSYYRKIPRYESKLINRDLEKYILSKCYIILKKIGLNYIFY